MTLFEKLLEVQKGCPTLGFDASNPHFKNRYITLGKVLEIVLPLLQQQGVFLSQPLGLGPNGPVQITRFVDVETGETYEEAAPLVLEKQSPQAVGSASTYYKRYAVLSALGLVGDEDDDAEQATGGSRSTISKNTEQAGAGISSSPSF